MPETRYHELLGLPEEIADPDYYQLLGLDHGPVENAHVEERFKQRMSKLQQIENPKHKDFIEFLKGELKKARAILTDGARRSKYDGEMRDERIAALRKLVAHLLVDGQLSQQAEISLVGEGRHIGLELSDIEKVVEEEIQRRGAKRVEAKRTDAITQSASNSMIRGMARELDEARIAARFAEAKAKHADLARERAEEAAQVAMRRAQEAQVLVRQTAKREAVAAAVEEQERGQLEGQVRQMLGALEEKQREIADLRRKLGAEAAGPDPVEHELLRLAARARRAERILFAVAVVAAAAAAGHAARIGLPAAAALAEDAAQWTVRAGAGTAALVAGAVALALMGLCTWSAGRPRGALFASLTALMAVLAAAASALYWR